MNELESRALLLPVMGSSAEDDVSLLVATLSLHAVILVEQANLSLKDSIGSVDRPVREIGFLKRVVDLGFGIRRLLRGGFVAG